jgi:hypothetical protein
MNEIQCVYIINSDGTPIFIHEKFTQGTDDVHHALFSGFVAAFQTFVLELGADETNIVLGNSNIFSSYDKKNKLYFVLKCSLDVSPKEMNQILGNIKELVNNFLSEKMDKIQDLEKNLLENLRDQINDLIIPKSNIETFLEIL